MNSKSKKITFAVIIILAILLITAISVTAAYLTSRRNAEGYLNFASGLSIQYRNIEDKGTSKEFGNLLHFVDKNSNSTIDDGELESLKLTNVQPRQEIKLANPNLTAKEGSASFALRAKLVLTDTSDPNNPVEYVDEADIEEFLKTGENPLLLGGDLNFAAGWEYNADDNYHYYVASDDTQTPIFERLKEVSYGSETVYLFEGDQANEDVVTIVIIDDEPLEEIPVKSLKIELYIEAIEYLSINPHWANV